MEDVITEVAEVPEVVVDSQDDVRETPEVVVEEPKKFKAWELKPKEQSHVPYDRFQELVNERDVLARALQSREPQQKTEEAPRPKTLADIRIEDYTDPIDFLKDRDDALRRSIFEELNQSQQLSHQQQAAQKYITDLGTTFSNNVEASIKHNPDIQHAVEFFDAQAHQINADIIHELMVDENVGELMHAIATDETLLREMFNSRPNDFIRKLHKMSAKIDKQELYGNKEDSESNTETNSVKETIRKTVPTQVKPNASKPVRDPSKMNLDEYRRFVKNGYK